MKDGAADRQVRTRAPKALELRMTDSRSARGPQRDKCTRGAGRTGRRRKPGSWEAVPTAQVGELEAKAGAEAVGGSR